MFIAAHLSRGQHAGQTGISDFRFLIFDLANRKSKIEIRKSK